MSTPRKIRFPMAWAYQQICEGEDPWYGLGNFTNDWYSYAKDNREALISEPLTPPQMKKPYTRRWAAFCAASVEFLCERYHIPCPEWVHDPRYTLKQPWWHTKFPRRKSMRAFLKKTTPAVYQRRNIFCGSGHFRNKYEMYQWIEEAHNQGIANPREALRYAREKEAHIHKETTTSPTVVRSIYSTQRTREEC